MKIVRRDKNNNKKSSQEEYFDRNLNSFISTATRMAGINNTTSANAIPDSGTPAYAEKIEISPDSTFVSPAIKTKNDLIAWVLTGLGYPLVTVELTTSQLNYCIQNALELYTKYAHFDEQYLAVNLANYHFGDEVDSAGQQILPGLDLSEYRVSVVRDISTPGDFGGMNDLFFGEYAYMNSSLGGAPFLNNTRTTGGGFTTYHNWKEFSSLCHRITGSNPDWSYDKFTHMLTLYPAPRRGSKSWILLTVEAEPPVEALYGNQYLKRIVLAYAKILLGVVRSKFQSVQLVGGGNINSDIGQEGQQELLEIINNISRDESKGNMFFIC